MKANQDVKNFASTILVEMMPILDEKQQRHLSGIIASALGYGGVSFVNSITGQSRNTIVAGTDHDTHSDDIKDDESPIQSSVKTSTKQTGRIRRPGGGRKPIETKYPDLAEKIEEIISDDTYGNPEKPLRYTSKSLRKIAEALMEKGINVCHVIVAKTLESRTKK